MPKIHFPKDQRDEIIEMICCLSFMDQVNLLDEIVHSKFKSYQISRDLTTLESNISYEEKIKIWENCRNSLQRLLLFFLQNKSLIKQQLEKLNEIKIQLGEPVFDLKKEGQILLQVREFSQNNKVLKYKLDFDSNIFEYNVD